MFVWIVTIFVKVCFREFITMLMIVISDVITFVNKAITLMASYFSSVGWIGDEIFVGHPANSFIFGIMRLSRCVSQTRHEWISSRLGLNSTSLSEISVLSTSSQNSLTHSSSVFGACQRSQRSRWVRPSEFWDIGFSLDYS